MAALNCGAPGLQTLYSFLVPPGRKRHSPGYLQQEEGHKRSGLSRPKSTAGVSLHTSKDASHRGRKAARETDRNQYLAQGFGTHLLKFGPRPWAVIGCWPSLPSVWRRGGTFSSGTFPEVKDCSGKKGGGTYTNQDNYVTRSCDLRTTVEYGPFQPCD